MPEGAEQDCACRRTIAGGKATSEDVQDLTLPQERSRSRKASSGQRNAVSILTRISGPTTSPDRALTLAQYKRAVEESLTRPTTTQSRIPTPICNPTMRTGMELAGFLSGPPWSAACVLVFQSYRPRVGMVDLSVYAWCKKTFSHRCFASRDQ